MGIFLNPGNEGFSSVVSSQLYVDKTGLIDYINQVLGTEQRMLCVSRPRRFGKSMAVKMLVAYYSKGCDSKQLFQHLKIKNLPTYEKELNKHNVIYLDMQWFHSVAKEKGISEQEISYLQKEVIQELKEQYPTIIEDNIILLSEALFRIYSATKERFIIIIDEWDYIFREDKENVVQQERYINFLRGMFKGILADVAIELVYITGILPIKKYGTQSALNNFDEYTMLDPTPMEEYMGFTKLEVQNLCKQYNMDLKKMNRWYDGYIFSNEMHIYSPKSVVDAVRRKKISNYWTSTETYEALQIYIDLDMYGLREAIVSMLSNSNIKIDTWAFQNDMTSLKSKDDVLTLLVHLGYLAYNEETSEVFIPNEEVRGEFIRAIKNGKRPEMIKAIQHSERLLKATIQRDEEEVARLIEEVHSANTSPNFYNNEQALRSVIQLAYISSMDDYVTIQELPSGTGYADLLFLPRKHLNKPAILIELKWDKSVEGAIGQIKSRNYVEAIENYAGEILLVGINYNKKDKVHECKIERYIREET